MVESTLRWSTDSSKPYKIERRGHNTQYAIRNTQYAALPTAPIRNTHTQYTIRNLTHSPDTQYAIRNTQRTAQPNTQCTMHIPAHSVCRTIHNTHFGVGCALRIAYAYCVLGCTQYTACTLRPFEYCVLRMRIAYWGGLNTQYTIHNTQCTRPSNSIRNTHFGMGCVLRIAYAYCVLGCTQYTACTLRPFEYCVLRMRIAYWGGLNTQYTIHSTQCTRPSKGLYRAKVCVT